MAELDEITIEEAGKAFNAEASKLDAWTTAVDEGTTQETEPSKEEAPAEPVQAGEAANETTAGDAMPSREEARKLVRYDYMHFDDVVENGRLVPERLAEYTSVIPYRYTSFATGEQKIMTMPKYPGFLDIFGVEKACDISAADVMKHFCGEEYEKAMYADRQANNLAKAAGRIIEYSGMDMSRALTEKDYDIMSECGVDHPHTYKTVGEVLSMDASMFEFCPDSELKCTYNSDYEDEVSGLFGAPTVEEAPGVVSLDDVMSGLDMKLFDRMTQRKPRESNEESGVSR